MHHESQHTLYNLILHLCYMGVMLYRVHLTTTGTRTSVLTGYAVTPFSMIFQLYHEVTFIGGGKPTEK